MLRSILVRAAIAATSLASGASLNATVLAFSGSVTGLGVGGPDASCDPLPFRSGIAADTSAGHSSLGDFTYSHDICLGGADAPSYGTFIIDFGIDSFEGTLNGGAVSTPIPGISDVAWTYTILSGTGRFLGSSGSFDGAGLADARTRPTHVSLVFAGNIDAPAVPEPGAWAMMLLGLGALAFALRYKKGPIALAQVA